MVPGPSETEEMVPPTPTASTRTFINSHAGSQLLTNSLQRETMEAWGNLGLVETRDHSVGPEGCFQNC